nr:MAG TPA: hypothetical protein [Caudoviricetes sp.]
MYIDTQNIFKQRRWITCSQCSQNVPKLKNCFGNNKNVDISIVIRNKYILVPNVPKNIYTYIGKNKKH